jgi:hypothetical protein
MAIADAIRKLEADWQAVKQTMSPPTVYVPQISVPSTGALHSSLIGLLNDDHTQYVLLASGSARMKAYEQVVTLASAGTDIQFPSLSINTHKHYHIQGNLKSTYTTGTQNVSLYFNNDETATDYYSQLFTAISTTLSGVEANNAVIGLMGSNASLEGTLFEIDVMLDIDGYARAIGQYFVGGSASTVQRGMSGIVRSSGTLSDITQIDLIGQSNFAVGSWARLIANY